MQSIRSAHVCHKVLFRVLLAFTLGVLLLMGSSRHAVSNASLVHGYAIVVSR